MRKSDSTAFQLSDVKGTMLVTLNFHAMDSRVDGSLLNDRVAADVLNRTGVHFSKLQSMAMSGDRYAVMLRARQLDDWAIDFLGRHPDATVLHLGCGLDSRAFRLDLPESVRWFDVDLPEVIEVRRRVYRERDGYRMIGASVTDPDALAEVPEDRPTLIIAEGLLMYLEPAEVEKLIKRLTSRFPAGELIFDSVSEWIVKIPRWALGPFQGFGMSWAIGDDRELERLDPRLTLLEATSALARRDEIPVASHRRLYAVIGRFGFYRDAIRLFRYGF
jgi:methyltransferase (TIGR00027 family)